MDLTFDSPMWLALAGLAVPLGVLGARWFGAMSPVRRATAVVARGVLIGLVAMALAGSASIRESDRVIAVAVVDVSRSVLRYGPEDFAERIATTLSASGVRTGDSGRGDENLAAAVLVGREAVAAVGPVSRGFLPRLAEALRTVSASAPEAGGTALASGIERAAALVPPGATGRAVVFTDGRETAGDAREAAGRVSAGTSVLSRVDVVGVPVRAGSEVMIERVDAPPRAPSESAVAVRVLLRSTTEVSGTLRLSREGDLVDLNGGAEGSGRRITFGPGRHVELAQIELPPGRLHRFEAVFEPDGGGIAARRGETGGVGAASVDTAADNNSARGFTLTPGEGRVLVVDGVSGGRLGGPGRVLPDELSEAGVEASVVAPSALPDDLLELEAFDLVLLQNVAADEVPDETQAALDRYVRELGGGLLFTGGPDAFGAGGWKGSRLEALIPVNLDLPDTLVMPELGIVFVLDASGSMSRSVLGSSRSQQQIANESAARAVQSLDPGDLVGAIAFNHAARVVRPLGPNDDPDETSERIRSIVPDGGTSIAPALEIAGRQLLAADAKLRHVVVLSDGRSEGAERLPDLAADLAAQGVRVSTIGVGDDADTKTLSEMAARGGGEFFSVINPNVLPRVFLRVVRVIRSPHIKEEPFAVTVLPTGSPLTVGVDDPPPLRGLVLTQARDDPGITYAMASAGGEPLLAHWNVELGQVGAFTSDAHEWARPWLGWPGYRRFWAQVTRSLARPSGGDAGELTIETDGDRARVRFTAADEEGEPIDLLSVPVTLYGPGGERRTVRLAQTGPGLYEGEAPAAEEGVHVAIARPSLGAAPFRPTIGGVVVAGGAEDREIGVDQEALREIAAAGGGEVYRLLPAAVGPDAAPDALGAGTLPDLYDRRGIEPARSREPLWPILIPWAIAVYLADVGTRRIAWDRFVAGGRRTAAPAVERVAARVRKHEAAAETRSLGGSGPTPLTDEDAARVAREARERRRIAEAERVSRDLEERRRRLRTDRGVPLAEPGSAASSERTSGGSADDRIAEGGAPRPARDAADGDAAGLLAAKKRARDRYRED